MNEFHIFIKSRRHDEQTKVCLSMLREQILSNVANFHKIKFQ